MNLHRYDQAPDWELTSPNERNIWQRIAARTNGIVTPGNLVSLTGAALVTKGLTEIARGNTKSGLLKTTAGRLLDLGDGTVAHRTGTKGPVGEAIDAVVDKAEMVAGLPLLVKAEAIPKEVALVFGLQNTANALLTASAKRKGQEIHSTLAGKHTTFAQWAAMGAFTAAALSRESNRDRLASDLESTGYLLAGIATTLGVQATAEYLHTTETFGS